MAVFCLFVCFVVVCCCLFCVFLLLFLLPRHMDNRTSSSEVYHHL